MHNWTWFENLKNKQNKAIAGVGGLPNPPEHMGYYVYHTFCLAKKNNYNEYNFQKKYMWALIVPTSPFLTVRSCLRCQAKFAFCLDGGSFIYNDLFWIAGPLSSI